MPLFEAIANSIAAIEEARPTKGIITIRIERDTQESLDDVHANTIADIHNFEIEDNGVGFTTDNFSSFETMDSRAKAARGGKGIGRLLWLKAFSAAKVDSTYFEDGVWWRRTFTFRLSGVGIEDHLVVERPGVHSHRTLVRLEGFQERYRAYSPKSVLTLSRRLVEHCMEYFFLGTQPLMLVEDATDDTVDLGKLFLDEYRPAGVSRHFIAAETGFTITDALLRASADTQHRVHLCAHNRVVASLPLAGRIPHLDSTLTNDDGEQAVYVGYVTGSYLDGHVDAERTSFSIDRAGELALAGGPTWEELVAATVATIKIHLTPRTEASRERAVARVKAYVEREPRYRPLLTHRQEEVEQLPGSLSDSSLDLELHKMLNGWRHEVRREAHARLAEVDAPGDAFADHREAYRRVLGDLQEVAKSDLAEYVVHRATVLSFFEKLLGKQGNDRFAAEGALHGLIFPQRTTSDKIDFDDHSLWIIDERLAYHKYLASDIPFESQNGPVDIDGRDRPDVLIYNNPLAFATGSEPFGSVVVIEFKKPERDDYTEDTSPIRQVLSYVRQVREGKGRRPDSSRFSVPQQAPFYCYIIATLTPKLRSDAVEFGYMPAPDGLGYFSFNSQLNAYIELSEYRKVLDDAKKRNRAFFERLHIPVQ